MLSARGHDEQTIDVNALHMRMLVVREHETDAARPVPP